MLRNSASILCRASSRYASAASTIALRASFSSDLWPFAPASPALGSTEAASIPASTSVTRITLNVRNMIRLRCGNALPSASTSERNRGRQRYHSAHPVQPTTKVCAPTVCSRSDVAAAFESCWRCMRPEHPNHAQHDHAALKRAPYNRSLPEAVFADSGKHERQLQPINTNTSPLTRMSVHPTPPRPVCARSRRKTENLVAQDSPQTTTASTPEE